MTMHERINRYVDSCPAAVSGQDGHGTAFKVACALVWGFALDPEAAFPYFERYNATCCPSWKPREIRHKLGQAAKVAHEKPRGHLLGRGSRRSEAGEVAPKLVPVRLTPRKRRFGTVGTVFSNIHVYTREKECPSHIGSVGANTPSQASQTLEGLISVPGCQIGRPAEIEMADADWLAVEKSGLADDPLIQYALQMFGPGCMVLATGKDASCE